MGLGEQLRDEGIERVIENNAAWVASAMRLLPTILPYGEFMGEDLRDRIVASCGHPNSPNAWGALMRTARTRKLIIPTGRFAKAKSPLNHAHTYPIYVRGITRGETNVADIYP